MDATSAVISFGRREGMTIKTCDKCGAKININPMTNTILPMFSISKIENFTMGWQSVDLCSKCEKMLAEWLNNNRGQLGSMP